MADTAHKSEGEAKEYFDSPEVLAEKISRLAGWVRESSHFIGFTGAGISTACGIPDFRSGMKTVLKTGPGAWELKAKKKKRSSSAKTTSTFKAIPSYTHMTFCALQQAGLLKFLISQNTDGLHRRSGFPPEKLAELHGNSNLEKCKRCGRNYLRDFRTRNATAVHAHKTGRKCEAPSCDGDLYDSIINFGENLPEKDMEAGFAHSYEADLCLAMGSSLRVTPAADMPEHVGVTKGRRLVIVNLQKTPMDRVASMVIHAKCDTVMRALAAELGLVVPSFKLRRFVEVSSKRTESAGRAGAGCKLTARGVDVDGTPYTLFTSAEFKCDDVSRTASREPWSATFSGAAIPSDASVTVEFKGHYMEPALTIPIPVPTSSRVTRQVMVCVYDPRRGRWESVAPKGEVGASAAAGAGAGAGSGAATKAAPDEAKSSEDPSAADTRVSAAAAAGASGASSSHTSGADAPTGTAASTSTGTAASRAAAS